MRRHAVIPNGRRRRDAPKFVHQAVICFRTAGTFQTPPTGVKAYEAWAHWPLSTAFLHVLVIRFQPLLE